MPSPQPAIRLGRSEDLAAVTALLKGARLPTEDLMSAPDLHLWVLEVEGDVVGAIGMNVSGRVPWCVLWSSHLPTNDVA